MNRSTHLKLVVCGVALVSLSAIRPAAAQISSGTCDSGGVGSGSVAFCVEFDPGPRIIRVDYPGHHSFKVIVNVAKPFFLQIVATTLSPPGPQSRYPDGTSEACIPYVGATSDTVLGECALYDVTAFDGNTGLPIAPENEASYFIGRIHYRVAWNFPTLAVDDNPRELRAVDSLSFFFDETDGVFPSLQSGQDPATDSSADGFSQHIVVQETHANDLVGCLVPLNCSAPNNPSANVFRAGQTIPIKVVLSPTNPTADLRLTFDTDPSTGNPQLAKASGRSNVGNMFRAAAGFFEFDWSTLGLAPGVYALTIAPGTASGALFAPTTILVTLQ
jgi:hypothetical protein